MMESFSPTEEIGLDLGATLTKAVVVDAGAPLTDFDYCTEVDRFDLWRVY